MSLLVVGSVAYDGIETPFGKTDRILGGSATYISLTSSYFTDDVKLVGVVGHDFDDQDYELLKSRDIDLKGLQRDERSEEHTSELQSRGHLVCRLQLDKKKTSINENNARHLESH